VIAARSTGGEIVTYPIVETQQQEQVCRVLVPADIDSAVTAEIEAIAHTLLDNLQAVGVLVLSYFSPVGSVLVKKLHPHPQFRLASMLVKHLSLSSTYERVCDLPLGNPALNCGGAVMVNPLL